MKIKYGHLVLVRNTLVGFLFIMMALQTILTYMLAVSMEHKKEQIAVLIDHGIDKITQTHESHTTYIKKQLDQTIAFLKKASQESNNDDKKTSSISFNLYYQELYHYSFLKPELQKKLYNYQYLNFYFFILITDYPHPPNFIA